MATTGAEALAVKRPTRSTYNMANKLLNVKCFLMWKQYREQNLLKNTF